MIFVGCLFLGIGIGLVFDNAGAGTLIGVGVGFLLEGLLSSERFRGVRGRGEPDRRDV
jgi:hypothetical protein